MVLFHGPANVRVLCCRNGVKPVLSSFTSVHVTQVSWLRSQFPSLDIEVDGGVGPDTIHKCAEVRNLNKIKAPSVQSHSPVPPPSCSCLLQAGANMIVSGSAVIGSDDPRSVIALLRTAVSEAIQKRSLDRWDVRLCDALPASRPQQHNTAASGTDISGVEFVSRGGEGVTVCGADVQIQIHFWCERSCTVPLWNFLWTSSCPATISSLNR